ncbi:hypothetical protein [Amycolatopsis anabasis]|uniref:hypothetical protein n=1 Tax=Amycolatopsis anabasis TaxID=1840409 RepID=UPI00131D481C|nr:hypothetical protein [Amycolatopsis anabasis]
MIFPSVGAPRLSPAPPFGSATRIPERAGDRQGQHDPGQDQVHGQEENRDGARLVVRRGVDETGLSTVEGRFRLTRRTEDVADRQDVLGVRYRDTVTGRAAEPCTGNARG